MSLKLVLISDTHCHTPEIKVEGDVLIHAGDFLSSGRRQEAEGAARWFAEQAKHFKKAVCIAGNHDWFFYELGLNGTQDFFSQYGENIHYLLDSSINIDGANLYGSPWQPEFCNWAFNVPRGAAIKKYWDMIPEAGMVDVLITHGPPMGILDRAYPKRLSQHLGCEELLLRVQDSVPLLHVFGHIHGGYGSEIVGQTHFVNAAVCDEMYRVANAPHVISIMPEKSILWS